MTPQIISPACRAAVHYWKCDRAAAFHGTAQDRNHGRYQILLEGILTERFGGEPVAVLPAQGQGNHLTFTATANGAEVFIRVEDGPERDDNLDVESHVLREVRALGIPAPEVILADATRTRVPFAWQVLERIDAPDLNQVFKEGRLDLPATAVHIGRAVARWQALRPPGFGPFRPDGVRRGDGLQGFHPTYATYFHLHLERHLAFLADRGFLARGQAMDLHAAIDAHRDLLVLDGGCLVHKDLALWNILGTEHQILAYIDWDDAISGDPMDDLSLLGCFYGGSVLARAVEGYQSVRPLPPEAPRRFWLHLLRNMIVKAVIRVGAGYFDRDDRFFLVDAGMSGSDLQSFTHQRLQAALDGLRTNAPIESL